MTTRFVRPVVPFGLAAALILPSLAPASEHRSRGPVARFCHTLLVKTGLRPLRTPVFFLNANDSREIARVFEVPEYTPAEVYERLTQIWLRARLRPMAEIDAQIVRNATHYMNRQSLHGIRADDLLEQIVARKGMEHSFIKLADFVHDLERVILGFEFTGRIGSDRRPDAQVTLREVEINRIYRDFVVRAEWEFLSAIPNRALFAEAKRVRALDLPRPERRLALLMLTRAHGSLRSYRSVHRRTYLGHVPKWRLAENPFATGREDETVVVHNLIRLWAEADRAITRSAARLSGPTRAQVIGATERAARTREIRRRAIETEWTHLNPLGDDVRRLATALVGVMEDFGPAYRRRLRNAIELSRLPQADYLAHEKITARYNDQTWCE